ncbi:MAG: hypothetical protein OQJ78_03575 [Ignavibacteriaceae bacterium]|jgi:hypothetical protein|nr:hypothetical protein [Ignavibacteriaceae bacterium]
MYQINDKGNWIALKKKIRLAYPIVSEADLKLNEGDEGNLLARLQKKLSKTKREIIRMIDKL